MFLLMGSGVGKHLGPLQSHLTQERMPIVPSSHWRQNVDAVLSLTTETDLFEIAPESFYAVIFSFWNAFVKASSQILYNK